MDELHYIDPELLRQSFSSGQPLRIHRHDPGGHCQYILFKEEQGIQGFLEGVDIAG